MTDLKTDLKITILGCGDSAGVPRIGGDWGNCDPSEPRNRRTRPCILVQSATTTLVVDTGPDFNQQLTRANIQTLDAVLYTHAHSDHVMGMDDLRIISGRIGKRMPIYLESVTQGELKKRFNYLFEQTSVYYPAAVEPRLLDDTHFGKVQTVGDIEFIPFLQDHGQGLKSIGYRFGDVAYSTDMRDLDDAALAALKGIKTWICDCADYSNGKGTLHSNFPTVERLNAILGAKQVYLQHLKMFDDYQTLCRALPEGYAPAYDGLVIPS